MLRSRPLWSVSVKVNSKTYLNALWNILHINSHTEYFKCVVSQYFIVPIQFRVAILYFIIFASAYFHTQNYERNVTNYLSQHAQLNASSNLETFKETKTFYCVIFFWHYFKSWFYSVYNICVFVLDW